MWLPPSYGVPACTLRSMLVHIAHQCRSSSSSRQHVCMPLVRVQECRPTATRPLPLPRCTLQCPVSKLGAQTRSKPGRRASAACCCLMPVLCPASHICRGVPCKSARMGVQTSGGCQGAKHTGRYALHHSSALTGAIQLDYETAPGWEKSHGRGTSLSS
jgi:hypothetical protein